MYHKSFERERNFAGCSPRPDIIVLATRNQAESRQRLPSRPPAVSSSTFKPPPAAFSRLHPPQSQIPGPYFPPSLHSFPSALFYSSFCFRRKLDSLFILSPTVWPTLVSLHFPYGLSFRALLSLASTLYLFSHRLSVTFFLLLLSDLLPGSPASLSLILRDTDYLSLGVSSRVRNDRPTSVGPVRNSCLPCDRSHLGGRDFARWSGRGIYGWPLINEKSLRQREMWVRPVSITKLLMKRQLRLYRISYGSAPGDRFFSLLVSAASIIFFHVWMEVNESVNPVMHMRPHNTFFSTTLKFDQMGLSRKWMKWSNNFASK